MRRAAALATLLSLSPVTAWATDVAIGSGAGRLAVPVASYKEFRDRNLVRQRLDYSCGAASLATLLGQQLGDRTTEEELVAQLFESLDADQSRQREMHGFSLLDMKRVAEARGHRAAGFRLDIGQLARIDRAVIVFLTMRGVPHFSVLRGIRGDRVFLADPSLGNTRMTVARFRGLWAGEDGKGVVFVLQRPDGEIDLDWRELPGKDFRPPELLAVREMMTIGAAVPR